MDCRKNAGFDADRRRKLLIKFLHFALTSDSSLGNSIVEKQPRPLSKEEKAIKKFMTGVLEDRPSGCRIQTLRMFACLTDLNINIKTGAWWWRLTGRFVSGLLLHLFRLLTRHIGDDSGAIMQFHLLRVTAIMVVPNGKALGVTDGSMTHSKALKYSIILKTALKKEFSELREEIEMSHRIKYAEILWKIGLRRKAISRIYRSGFRDENPSAGGTRGYLQMQCHYIAGNFLDGFPEAFVLNSSVIDLCSNLPPSKENLDYEQFAHARLAYSFFNNGRIRDSTESYQKSLQVVENHSPYWTEAEFSGRFILRSMELAEHLINIGKYKRALQILESALPHVEFLDGEDQLSGVSHKIFQFAIRMHLDLLKSTIEDAPAVLDKFIAELETYDYCKSAKEARIKARKDWWRKVMKRPLLKNFRKISIEYDKRIANSHYLLNAFQHHLDMLDRLKDQKRVLSICLDPHASDLTRDLLDSIQIAMDNSGELMFVAKIKVAFSELDKGIDPVIQNLPYPHDNLAEIAVALKKSAIRRQTVSPALEKLEKIITGCSAYIPVTAIFVVELGIRLLEDTGQPFDAEVMDKMLQIMEALESISSNYGHPEDSYLVKSKIGGLYHTLGQMILSRSNTIEISGISHESFYDTLSVCVDRAAWIHSARPVSKDDFTNQELESVEIQKLLACSQSLEALRMQNCFGDSEQEELEKKVPCFISKRLGGAATKSKAVYGSQKIITELEAAQRDFEDAFNEAKFRFPNLSPATRRIRHFNQKPSRGVLWLHIFLIADSICCVGYLGTEVAGSFLPGFEDATVDDSLMAKIGNLVDTCVRHLATKNIKFLELCIQAPLEALPWIMLKDFVKLIPFSTPYHYDIGVGFTSASERQVGSRGAKHVVIGPSARRTDLAFGTLEFYTAWQHEKAERLDLSIDSKTFLEAAANAKLLHFSGHFSYREGSLIDSTITPKKHDIAGISLGFLQVQKSLLNQAIVILNLCGSGRSGSEKFTDNISVRISNSPRSANAQAAATKAFAATFLSKGATCVIATLWDVDDLPSFLFTHKLIQLLRSSFAVGVAVEQAGLWLKGLNRSEALTIVNEALELAPDEYTNDKSIEKQRNKIMMEISEGPEMPFSHPSYWAAYIVYGHEDL